MKLARIPFLFACLLMSCQSSSSASSEADGRPEQAGTGQVVAWVHLVDGAARVHAANGFSFEAEPGVPLLRTDRVQAGEEGFVVLELANRYLVRIDQAVTLGVCDIYLLDAPRASADYRQQIDQLLTKKERARGERIAGWHARLTGAQTVAPLAARRRYGKQEAARGLRDTKTTAGEKLAPMASTQGAEQEARPPALKKKKGARDTEDRPLRTLSKPGSASVAEAPQEEAPVYRGGVLDEDEEKEREAPADDQTAGAIAADPGGEVTRTPAPAWFVRTGATERKPKRAAPPLVHRLARDPGLRACLRQAVAGLPVRVEVVRLMLRVHNMRVQQVSLGGGLATPACAGEGVLHKPIPEIKEDCWVIIEVPLR